MHLKSARGRNGEQEDALDREALANGPGSQHGDKARAVRRGRGAKTTLTMTDMTAS